MKKVDFVRVTSELNGFGFGKGIKFVFFGIEDIIMERVEQGWDYCGYVPIETQSNGGLETISLIFQMEE